MMFEGVTKEPWKDSVPSKIPEGPYDRDLPSIPNKEISEASMPFSNLRESNLFRSLAKDLYAAKETAENPPIKNKVEGLRREAEVENELRDKYPESEGYKIESEVYLRDKDGNIVKDPVTGEARRVDFVVTKNGKVVDMIEVTSKTADKTEQCAKESRIRDAGGNYIKDSNGNLIEIPGNVMTRIERRD